MEYIFEIQSKGRNNVTDQIGSEIVTSIVYNRYKLPLTPQIIYKTKIESSVTYSLFLNTRD